MPRYRWFAVFSVLVYVLFLGGLVRALPSAATGSGDCIALGFPPVWNGMTLSEHTEGPATLAALDRHHRRALGLTGAQMATYEGSGEALTVWVAVVSDAAESFQLAGEMTQKIAAGKGRLDPPRMLHLGDLTVYKIIGGKWQHYYYVRGDRVYWLAIRSAAADRLALQAARAF